MNGGIRRYIILSFCHLSAQGQWAWLSNAMTSALKPIRVSHGLLPANTKQSMNNKRDPPLGDTGSPPATVAQGLPEGLCKPPVALMRLCHASQPSFLLSDSHHSLITMWSFLPPPPFSFTESWHIYPILALILRGCRPAWALQHSSSPEVPAQEKFLEAWRPMTLEGWETFR